MIELDNLLLRSQPQGKLPKLIFIFFEVAIFLFIFAWICLQSVTFFAILSIGIYFFGCITLMIASRRGRFAYAADVLVVFVAMLSAYPTAALEVQRRYWASSNTVERVFEACVEYRRQELAWPSHLQSLVPKELDLLPRDEWGNELSYVAREEAKVPAVGFSRRVGDYEYTWLFDGNVWCASWGAISSRAPSPPMFVFHY